MKFPLLCPLALAISTSPSLATAAALPVVRTVEVQAYEHPKIWPATPICATAGLEIGLTVLDESGVTGCNGRDLPKDPPWDLGSLRWDWPCLCKARGGKGTAIKSAGIELFFLYCGPDDTFECNANEIHGDRTDVVYPAIEKFCEQFEKV
ncbi:hypothetical protein N0V85_006430 [Neurospora sp. IMI 360204]|nr:hypothetical protein N0V85_006430 [Neurospora sp. IMI 360204]